MARIKTYGALNKTVKEIQAITNTAAPHLNDGILQIGTLAISDTTDQYQTTTELYFKLDGLQHMLAVTNNLEFASAYTVNTAAAASALYGAFKIEATGLVTPTITGKASGADQVYTTAAAAVAAMPATTAGSMYIGHIIVQSNVSAGWTANTDDLVAASDCLTVSFVDVSAVTIADINTMTNPDGAPAQ
jgi:hypothetical protein